MSVGSSRAGRGRPGRVVLPVDAVLDDVVAALRSAPAVIVTAPPGSGKTLIAKAVAKVVDNIDTVRKIKIGGPAKSKPLSDK